MTGENRRATQSGAEADSVDRFIDGMRRRETLRLALVSLFLLNALGAALFSGFVWFTRDVAPGFLVPAVVVEGLSIGLLVMIWRRSNRMRRMGRVVALPTRRFLERALDETRHAIREQRLLAVLVLGVLTPLFVLSVTRLTAAGKMSSSDAVSIGILYAVCLAVVLGVSWYRLRDQLASRQRRIAGLLSDYRD